MHFRFGPSVASAALVLLSTVSSMPAGAAATQPAIVAQAAATPDPAEGKDMMMTHCSRYQHAFARLTSMKSEMTRLQMAFMATDDIRPKLDALVVQTNDAMLTAQRRLQSCPANMR